VLMRIRAGKWPQEKLGF